MILDEQEVTARFESPLNLLNRLRAGLTPHSTKVEIPSIPPTAEKIVQDLDEKLRFGGLKGKAAGIMVDCLDELKSRITEVVKPTQLAQVAETMNKIINAEDKNKNQTVEPPQYIIYAPQFRDERTFEILKVNE